MRSTAMATAGRPAQLVLRPALDPGPFVGQVQPAGAPPAPIAGVAGGYPPHKAASSAYSAAARFGVGSNGNPGWPVSLSPSAHISSACFFIAGKTEAIFSRSRSAAIPG